MSVAPPAHPWTPGFWPKSLKIPILRPFDLHISLFPLFWPFFDTFSHFLDPFPEKSDEKTPRVGRPHLLRPRTPVFDTFFTFFPVFLKNPNIEVFFYHFFHPFLMFLPKNPNIEVFYSSEIPRWEVPQSAGAYISVLFFSFFFYSAKAGFFVWSGLHQVWTHGSGALEPSGLWLISDPWLSGVLGF